jgi:3-deoxy-D-manno-octulosonate 8-phosphate phosphatase (KDO 8-P phosphatase)
MDVPADIYEKAQHIRLLAMDVDGVLTNGEVIYTDNGGEMKIFNVKDGHGISMLLNSGVEVALITGRSSPITQRRADELKIPHVFQGVKNKLPVLESLLKQLGLELSQVAYVGDDTPDIPVMKVVGLAVCPVDAVAEVKRVSHYTTQAPGGCGAVREVTDLLMRSRLILGVDDTIASEVS